MKKLFLALFVLASPFALADTSDLMRMRSPVKEAAMGTPEVQAAIAEAQAKADKSESDEPVFLRRTYSLNFVIGIPDGAGVDLSITPKRLGRYVTTSIMASTTAAWWSVNGKLTLRVLAKRHVSPVISGSIGYLEMTSYADQIVQMFIQPSKDGTKFNPGLAGEGLFLGKAEAGLDFESTGFHFLIAGGIARQIGDSIGGREYNRIDAKDLTSPIADIAIGGRF